MTTRRSALAIAVFGKKVYIIGGYDGNASLSTVEVWVDNLSYMFHSVAKEIPWVVDLTLPWAQGDKPTLYNTKL